ncbi:MAG: glutathione S-transferase family protein [Steroidobacteraceae bacterium]
MQLIGMLDSPYVRRVAVSLQALGLPYTHRSLSVFRTYEQFKAINPVVKAPTFVCDDGTMLLDSTLILDYAETLAHPRSLLPAEPAARAKALSAVGLALAACEKSVQIVYERQLRPSEKQYEPWMQRVTQQLQAAYRALESEVSAMAAAPRLTAATIAAAVSWRFTQEKVPESLEPGVHPRLQALSQWAEAQPEFLAAPFDDTTLHV